MMIFIISQGGVQDSTRRELLKNISISLQDAIKNLDKLGVDLSVMSTSKPKQSKQRLQQFSQRNKEIDLALMRYVPQLHSYIENLVSGTLDETMFPYINGSGSSSSSSLRVMPASCSRSALRKRLWLRFASSRTNSDATHTTYHSYTVHYCENPLNAHEIIHTHHLVSRGCVHGVYP